MVKRNGKDTYHSASSLEVGSDMMFCKVGFLALLDYEIENSGILSVKHQLQFHYWTKRKVIQQEKLLPSLYSLWKTDYEYQQQRSVFPLILELVFHMKERNHYKKIPRRIITIWMSLIAQSQKKIDNNKNKVWIPSNKLKRW